MKTKSFLLTLFAVSALSISAQSEYATYLNKATTSLEAGDCESAQKFYNVYKELSGQTSSFMEKSLKECSKQYKKYKVGDEMPMTLSYSIENKTTGQTKSFSRKVIGRIVSVENNGEHGIAVYYYGSGILSEAFDGYLIHSVWIPSYPEFRAIIPNLFLLGYEEGDEFWTLSSNDSQLYKCVRLGQNGQHSTLYRDKDKQSSGILIFGYF